MTRIEQPEWHRFLRDFSKLNEGRPTRIGVFEASDGFVNDYWIEDGLPLISVDSYDEKGRPRVDIVFQNYTHSVADVSDVVAIDAPGSDMGLDISDFHGRTTQLRFEDWAKQQQEGRKNG